MSDTTVGSVDYGTAIRTTHIRPIDGEDETLSWTRTAPHDAHPFSTVGFRLPKATTGPRFESGTGNELTRNYRLPGDRSLASTALFGNQSSVDWSSVYRQWGTLLAALHTAAVVTDSVDAEPPARTRLRAWWSAPELGEHRRTTARSMFLDGLQGSARDYLDDVLAEDLRRNNVLVHGWAGIGHSVLDDDGHVVAMVGEDVGRAPVEYDLGALTAQSVELAVFSPPGTAPSPGTMRAALLDGYAHGGGPNPDRAVLTAHTVEHIVRHVADFVWFSDFDDAELHRWSSLVNWLDDRRVGR